MSDLQGSLAELVRHLDSLKQDCSLIKLTRAIQAAGLNVADVAPYVKETRHSYHRGLVVRQDQYELLILTWLPGQGSPPHDHAGSISAMQVLAGEAVEGCWRIGVDGYADLEFENTVSCGQMTAWQDAGLHTIRNPAHSAGPLVTLHVYAPPLKDFRHFIPRGNGVQVSARAADRDSATVLVVGGGFSGAMTAAQLIRRASAAQAAVRVILVERRGTVGEGLAYATREKCHLLNVPAGRMSVWPDRPHDFVEWVANHYVEVQTGDFLPRAWYGEYVRESLLSTAREANEGARLSLVFDEVRRISRRPTGGWMVHFGNTTSVSADAVVLAIGHRPPPDPIGRLWNGPRDRFIGDPWRPLASTVIDPDEPVLILGSGLTAVDTVLTLTQEPRRAPITLVSRRGLISQAHARTSAVPLDLQSWVAELLMAGGGPHARTLVADLRNKLREAAADGQDWRAVIDGLRPHTATIWQALPVAERRKFLARLRPYWEVHRHRMAPAVAEQFAALVDRGVVRIIAGTVASANAESDGVRLYIRERGEEKLLPLQASWVINCIGPTASNSEESNPAIGSLLVHGWVRPDPLGLGLDTNVDGQAVSSTGELAAGLFVVGTLRKSANWESTAVPELRTQAAAVADHILKELAETGCRTLRHDLAHLRNEAGSRKTTRRSVGGKE